MEIIKINEVREEVSPVGVTIKSIFDSEDIVLKNIILKPNEVVPEHNASINVLFYIMEGKGTVINDGVEEFVKKDFLVQCMKGSLVSFREDAEEKLKILVIRGANK